MESILLGPRAIDDLGRVVIPLEIRVLLGLAPGAKVAFAVESGRICLIRQPETSAPTGSNGGPGGGSWQ